MAAVRKVANLKRLIREMQPVLDPEWYAYCALVRGRTIPASAVAWFREQGAESVILPLRDAESLRLRVTFPCNRITLEVPSALEAVGLTAAVSRVLTEAGIACNVVAAMHHDHLFVPAGRGIDALRLLEQLAAEGLEGLETRRVPDAPSPKRARSRS